MQTIPVKSQIAFAQRPPVLVKLLHGAKGFTVVT